MSRLRSKAARTALAAVFWLAVWALCARAVGQEIVLPGPVTVARHLWSIVRSGSFLHTVVFSFLRVFGGFLCGVAAGTLLAALCCLSELPDALIQPVMRVVRATPVASFIILIMLWLPYTLVPVCVAALLVAPVVFGNVRTGIRETDPALLEVAKVYRFTRWQTLSRVYVPSVLPYFRSAALTALGLAWKAGIAAEVLLQLKSSIGGSMYFSKYYLETADLFAWTALVILFSLLLETLLRRPLREKGKEAPQ